jgi:hypothetical protein
MGVQSGLREDPNPRARGSGHGNRERGRRRPYLREHSLTAVTARQEAHIAEVTIPRVDTRVEE